MLITIDVGVRKKQKRTLCSQTRERVRCWRGLANPDTTRGLRQRRLRSSQNIQRRRLTFNDILENARHVSNNAV
jgi:hypothetical protein